MILFSLFWPPVYFGLYGFPLSRVACPGSRKMGRTCPVVLMRSSPHLPHHPEAILGGVTSAGRSSQEKEQGLSHGPSLFSPSPDARTSSFSPARIRGSGTLVLIRFGVDAIPVRGLVVELPESRVRWVNSSSFPLGDCALQSR